jgi:hypothetical protein
MVWVKGECRRDVTFRESLRGGEEWRVIGNAKTASVPSESNPRLNGVWKWKQDA